MSDDHIAWDRPSPPIGHNQPPAPTLDMPPEQWTDRMANVFEEAQKRRDDLLASYNRFHEGYPLAAPVAGVPPGIESWSNDVQGRAGDLRAKIAALLREGSHLHGIEKAPILSAGRAVDGFFRAFCADLEAAVTVINGRRTTYAQYIEARSRGAAVAEANAALAKAAEAAKAAAQTGDYTETAVLRDRAAAAQQVAQASPAEHSRVHGPMGSVSSLRATWKFFEEESDLMTLARAVVNGTVPLTYLQFNTTRINLAVRTEKIYEILGCSIRQETVVR